ncbi:MAG: hypothetical protein WA151_13935 [Desulfatirhabdiaceae bacterium]
MKKLERISFCLDCSALFDGFPDLKDAKCPECGSGQMCLSDPTEVARMYSLVDEPACPHFLVNDDGEGFCDASGDRIGGELARA